MNNDSDVIDNKSVLVKIITTNRWSEDINKNSIIKNFRINNCLTSKLFVKKFRTMSCCCYKTKDFFSENDVNFVVDKLTTMIRFRRVTTKNFFKKIVNANNWNCSNSDVIRLIIFSYFCINSTTLFNFDKLRYSSN